MDIIKKLVIAVIAAALIVVAIYVIFISYQAQETRKERIAGEAPESLQEPDSSESLPEPGSQMDSVPTLPQPPIEARAETLQWRSLPREELNSISEKYPLGSPNPVFTSAARRILPAVVTVQSEVMMSNVPQDKDHKNFWERHGEDDPGFFQQGTGSGIIISSSGYILTNYHVVEQASSYNVILRDKREYPATFIGGDPNTDVALLRIQAANLPTAYIGNSDSVQIGEWVMAVGSPLNFTSTITAGIVSALGRNIQIIDSEYGVENFIQTDAVINPGNSGGALINLNGEVIGVNTAIATRTGLYQGYGFAIPINLATKIVNDLLAFGEVRRGLLGVSISNVDNRVAKGVGLPRPTGVLVQGLQPGNPAQTAGIRQGDVILSVNGWEVISVNDLQIKIASKNPGETVTLKVWRDRQELIFQVALGQAPISRREANHNNQSKKSFKNLGLDIRDLTAEEKRAVDLDYGVYVSNIKLGSPANKGGIFPRFIIHEVNGKKIENKKGFEKLINQLKSGQVIRLLCRVSDLRTRFDDRILFVEVE